MSYLKENPAGPDRDLVEVYSRPRDRKAAAVFVGRQDTISAIEANCRDALWSVRNGENASGQTFLVQGAPGAGKSALLAHLVKRWDGRKGCPQVLVMSGNILKDVSATALAIAKKINPDKAKLFRQRIISGGATSLRIPGIAEGEVSSSRETEGEEATFEVLASLKPPREWEQPLCILVDEIQKVGDEHHACLLSLQLGDHGLPIVPIYAGLADSSARLYKAASPRLETGNTHTLGVLASEEVHSCVKQMLDRCRIAYTDDQLEHLAAGISERSEGWPQHVRTETAALFWGLRQVDCDLRVVDFDAVNQRARTYREESYEARQSTEMERSVHLVAAVMQAIPKTESIRQGQVVDIIREKEIPDGPEDWRLPEGTSAEGFLDHLIHQGILQPIGKSRLICPIPSLRAWLIDQVDD